MKAMGTKLPLQAALVLIFLGPAIPLHAQSDIAGSILFICNKGTVPVEVVSAIRPARSGPSRLRNEAPRAPVPCRSGRRSAPIDRPFSAQRPELESKIQGLLTSAITSARPADRLRPPRRRHGRR